MNESPESHTSIQIFSTQDKVAHRKEKPSRQVSMASEGQTERLRASNEDMGGVFPSSSSSFLASIYEDFFNAKNPGCYRGLCGSVSREGEGTMMA